MGAWCGHCNGYRAIHRIVTPTGLPPATPQDVIAYELECMHLLGSEKYRKFADARANIITDAERQKMEIESASREKIAALWTEYFGSK